MFKVSLGGPVPGQEDDTPAPKKQGASGRAIPTQAGSNFNPKGRGGRPKAGESFAELISTEMQRIADDYLSGEESPNDDPTALSVKQAIVRKFIRQALSGNLLSWVELMNRTEGKVADKTQMDVNHTVRVVPWDDDDAPGLVYQQNRGLGEKPESTTPPDVALRETPALPPPEDDEGAGDDGGGDRN